MKKILIIDLISLPVCRLDDEFFMNHQLNMIHTDLIVLIKSINHYTYDQHIAKICSLPESNNIPFLIASPGKTSIENQPDNWSDNNKVFDLFEENKYSNDILSLWDDYFFINNLDKTQENKKTEYSLDGQSPHSTLFSINKHSLMFQFNEKEEKTAEDITLERENGVFAQLFSWSQAKISIEKQFTVKKEFRRLQLHSFEQLLELSGNSKVNLYYLDIHLTPELLKNDDQILLINHFIENTSRKNKSLQIRIQ